MQYLSAFLIPRSTGCQLDACMTHSLQPSPGYRLDLMFDWFQMASGRMPLRIKCSQATKYQTRQFGEMVH